MILVLFIFYFIIIISLATCFTVRRRIRRTIVSILLMLYAVFMYPWLVPMVGKWKGLDGVASLMLGHFLLLIGAIILFIASFFTEKEVKRADRLED
ncbi:hypothetical protein SAMN04488137_2613 [Fictibacillus solisalsi]|uniref:Uncharacterized protein n=1 Tax=Fictibacillus solisalsi TaxID=459525 RepID=A0A1G9X899_9BACL|nr:hypothetical protein [Fictibacillus solisalsi]SDM92555.1 hypothetical protein SAMN04488137_2613 [Fictibacillus solisalsi]